MTFSKIKQKIGVALEELAEGSVRSRLQGASLPEVTFVSLLACLLSHQLPSLIEWFDMGSLFWQLAHSTFAGK